MGVKNIFLNVFAVFSVFVLFFSFFINESKAYDSGVSIEEVSKTEKEVVVRVTVTEIDSALDLGESAALTSNNGCNLTMRVKRSDIEDYTESDELLTGFHCENDNVFPAVFDVKISGLTPNTSYDIKPNIEAIDILADKDIFDDPQILTISTTAGVGPGTGYSFSLTSFELGEYSSAFEGSFLEEIKQTGYSDNYATPGVTLDISPNLDSLKDNSDYPVSFSLVACQDIAFNVDGEECETAFEDHSFVLVLYKKTTGEKISEADVIFPTNDDELPEEYNQVTFLGLDFATDYTAKMYYKADKGGDAGGVNLFDSNDEEYYEIASLDLKTMDESELDENGYGQTETGNNPDYDPASTSNYYSNWLDITCKYDPDTWDGCAILWFHSLIYLPAQGILYVGALFTDSMLSFSIGSVIYRSATFAETGWQIVRDISNLFFIIILVYVAIGTILGTQKGGVQKIITQLIIVALLINFSLFFTRLIVDSSNILARVFYNTLTIEGKQETPVVKNTGVEYKSLSRAIVGGLDIEKTINSGVIGGGDPNKNLGTIFVMLVFAVVFYAVAAWEFFLIGFMFVQRILEIWISMIFAPFAFVSRIVPGWGKVFGRASWDKWIKNLLCWCFVAPIFLFFVMLISAFINSEFLTGLIVAKTEGNLNVWQYWVAILLQFMIIMGLLKMVRGIAKDLGCESANQFVDLGGKWAKKVGFGAGALALGVASGGAAAIGRNTLGRMGTNVAQSESLKLKSKQGGMSGWIARQQLNTANKLSKSSFDVRKTAAGSGLKNLGFKESGIVGSATSALGFNEKQSDGYKERLDKRKKKEVDFYKELKVDKAGHDKMKEKYGAGLEDFIKNNATKYGYKEGEKMSDFKKANSAKFKEAKNKFDSLRDDQMYQKFYDKYKKKNDLTNLTEEQKKEALKTVRKDKLETTKGVFEKKNGTDRNLEDVNQDRLNAYAEVIEKKRDHLSSGGAKSAGNVGVGGAAVNVAGGLSMAGAGAIGAFAGIPLLEASAKGDAYKQAAEELRDMAKAEGKSKNKREASERDVAKKIEKEEKYQEKVKEKLATWERLAEDHDRTAREESKVKVGKLHIDDPELDGKLEKLMEMNDRKMAEHQLKRDSLSEKAKDFAKKGKSLPEKEHEEFVKAVTEIKKLEKENKDLDGLTENFKKSGERLDNLNDRKGNIGKPTGGEEKKEEPKKDEGKK